MAPKDLAHSRLPLFFFSACGVCYKGHAPQLCSSLFSQTPVKDCEAQDRLALVDLWPAQLSPPQGQLEGRCQNTWCYPQGPARSSTQIP